MSWKMQDGTILRGYDRLGNKRKDKRPTPWAGLCIIGLLLMLVGQVVLNG